MGKQREDPVAAADVTELIVKLRSYSPKSGYSRVMREAAGEIERLKVGYDRYQVIRALTPHQFTDAWAYNIRTGKPFDEIIDQLKPFIFGANLTSILENETT